MKEIDKISVERALRYNPLSLLFPIGAKDQESLEKYVGDITEILVKGEPNMALLVKVATPPEINKKLAIWKLDESKILHANIQVWVHVDFKNYRKAYQKAFPGEDLSNMVLDHILNRRVARIAGFKYVRIIPISKSVNSSSGKIAEQYGYEYYKSPAMQKVYSAIFIQYADFADIVKMLNIKPGGKLQDGVNDAQKYLLEEE